METATITRPAPDKRYAARLRALDAAAWARVGLAALVLGVIAVIALRPTYPTYDSLYALIWGRELVGLEALSFEAYRAPTQHPLAIALGAALQIFGTGADRVLLVLAWISLVALAWAMYRLGRLLFTPLVGAAAAALLVTRLDFPFLAARGYIDVAYLAAVFWAAALEAERWRRGEAGGEGARIGRLGWGAVALLSAAGLMRPEAWLLAGLYFLWLAARAGWRERVLLAAATGVAPVLWAATDFAVTGDPLFSLHSTSGLAEELERDAGISAIPQALPYYLIKTVKLPVALAAAAGFVAALWLVPRRTLLPVALLASGIGTFVLVAFAGLSVIPRYLAVSQVTLLVFAAFALAGWTLLARGGRERRWWIAAAALIVLCGAAYTVATFSVRRADNDLRWRAASHDSLQRVLDDPRVVAAMRCGPVTTPNHKLIPEVRWLADLPEERVLARTQERWQPRLRADGTVVPARGTERGVWLAAVGRESLVRTIYVDGGGDALLQIPPAGFQRAAVSGHVSAYVAC